MQDLEDLTQHLSATLVSEPSAGGLTLGDADPLPRSEHLAGGQPHDPFDALAAASKQQTDMPYATYGQLVTPQAIPQQQTAQEAAPTSDALSPSYNMMAGASSQQHQQAAEAVNRAAHQQPSSGLSSVPDSLDRLASIPSPCMPDIAAKDLPLVVVVSEPQRREAAGVLGMKGGVQDDHQTCCSVPLKG